MLVRPATGLGAEPGFSSRGNDGKAFRRFEIVGMNSRSYADQQDHQSEQQISPDESVLINLPLSFWLLRVHFYIFHVRAMPGRILCSTCMNNLGFSEHQINPLCLRKISGHRKTSLDICTLYTVYKNLLNPHLMTPAVPERSASQPLTPNLAIIGEDHGFI